MGRPKKEKPTHSSGRYVYKATIGHNFDGTPKRKAFYSKISKEDAKSKANQYIIDKEVAEQIGETFIIGKSTFSEVAKKWLASVKPTLSDNAYSNYEVAIRLHLNPYFKNAIISNIKAIDIQNFFNSISKKSSLESMKKYKNCLNGIFKMAVDNDYCTKNPCLNIKLVSEIEDKIKRTYTKRQAYLVSRFAREHKDGLGIILMLDYGLRKGELLGLKLSDINFKNKTLHIQRSVVDVKNKNTGKVEVKIKPPKNKQSNREIPLKNTTINRLSQLSTEFIISNTKGSVYSPHNWSMRNYKKFMNDMHNHYLKYNIDIPILSPHELRHTRATLWVNSGKNLFAIASVLGHSDLKMLQQRYAHKDTESIRELLNLD
jgi:integrase